MIESIQGAYNAIKGGLDIAQGFQALKTETAINQAVIEIQRGFLEAQRALNEAETRHAADLRCIGELEAQIMEMKDWEAQKQRYELKDTGQGSLAYALKEGVETGEPAHWICPQCYEDRCKSILKHETLYVGRAETLACHRCGFDIVTRGVRHEQPKVVGSRKPPSTSPRRW